MSNADLESRIVDTTKAALEIVGLADSRELAPWLDKARIALQPYDLDFVLSRHPALFRSDYLGRWSLA